MEYKEFYEKKGVKIKKKYKQELKILSDLKKGKVRQVINEQILDIEDSIADNAKMIMLLASLIMRIYNALPDEIKDNIPTEDRNIIEYALSKYQQTTTRMDLQFQREGMELIDKLLNRQQEIAETIENVYYENN